MVQDYRPEHGILALDPSFKNLAYSVFDIPNQRVILGKVGTPLGTKIGFDVVFNAVGQQWSKLYKALKGLYVAEGIGRESGIVIDSVFSETPPPVSQFSSGLYALDTFILSQLFMRFQSVKEVYSIPPSYLSTVHGTSKFKKTDSTVLARYFIDELLADDLKVEYVSTISDTGRVMKGKLSNDVAESFIFLLRAIVRYNIYGLGNKIMSYCAGLGSPTEILLTSRD